MCWRGLLSLSSRAFKVSGGPKKEMKKERETAVDKRKGAVEGTEMTRARLGMRC